MGNSKSKKVKINQSDTEKEVGTRERINSLQTDLSEATNSKKLDPEARNENGSESDRVKEVDNASSASTVEVLDENALQRLVSLQDERSPRWKAEFFGGYFEVSRDWEIVIILSDAAARSKSSRMPIKLYYLPPTPECRAVMMLARVMGLELDLVMTDIVAGDHVTPEYLKMNPQHSIPTMDDNGFILWESRAIMQYFVNAYGQDALYPRNPRLRALVDSRLNFDMGTLFLRYMNLYGAMLFRGEEYNEDNAAKLDEALGWLNSFLDGRTYVAGDHMTIADISMIVTITDINEFDYDFSAHHNVTKWFKRTKKALEPYGYKEIDEAGAQILAAILQKD